MSPREIDHIPLRISQKPLLNKLGRVKKTKALSARVRKQIDKAIEDIHKKARPKAVFRILSAETDMEVVSIGKEAFFKSRTLAKIINPCKKVVIFLVTLGKEVDGIIDAAFEKQPYYGFILDAAASLAIESSAEYVKDFIDKNYTGKEEKTLRYSPGFYGWPIHEQKKLFQALPSDKVEVELSDSYFMSPQKSISGLIGIGSEDQVSVPENICSGCPKTECRHRKQ
ncbi:MAG: vitamin B12 dependent-methionine synthase activation domain-containing protein [bacterium]